ncbi:MAG TPA: hypothetical protein VJA26_17460 [Gammaproteobacteria bacterium]|nr:hypothetical protein [Gammaproteobacteria bacterium]
MHTLHIRAAAALAAALFSGCSPNPNGSEQATPAPRAACDRVCLEGFIDRYLDALVARDPSRLPLAPNVTFVENNQALEVGDGTWRTVTDLGTYRHYFSDIAAGQAAMIGIVEENGTKVIYDLRLAINNGQITEIEALVARDPNGALLYEEHGEPHPKFLEEIPPEQRLSREDLAAVVNKYLSGMERNDPNGDYSFFHDECDRWEHARRTTNNDPEAYGHSTDTVFVTLNCREQFQTGFLGFVTRIRDRRYVVIDEERQTVFAFALLDHNGTIREIPLSSGTTFVVPPYFSSPRTLQVGEAWRIEDGKLRQIEMTLTELPYGMRPGFDSGDDWLARDAAARAAAPAAPASAEGCDRACLNGFVDKFLSALVAHDPALLPTSPDLKYTENGQRLNPGDGLWGTATELGDYQVYAADPATGTAGFYGTIVETDVPGLLTLRLAVENQRVTEIEAVVFRQETVGERGGTLTLFAPRQPSFDPAGFARVDPALTAATSADPSAAELRTIAASYYAGLLASDGAQASVADMCQRRENGVRVTGVADAPAPDGGHPDFRPASLGCAAQLSSHYFSYMQRLRDQRTLVADVQVGLLLDLAFLDVPNDQRLVDVPGVGSVALPMTSTGPYSVMLAQLYKVQDGKIVHIEAVSRPVPYGMRAGWQ